MSDNANDKIKPVDPNAGRPGQPIGYYNEDSKDHHERYWTAERALRVRPKWQSIIGISLAAFALVFCSAAIGVAMAAKWTGWYDIPSLPEITEYFGIDYNGDYEPLSRNEIFERIGNTILSYIPEWVPRYGG